MAIACATMAPGSPAFVGSISVFDSCASSPKASTYFCAMSYCAAFCPPGFASAPFGKYQYIILSLQTRQHKVKVAETAELPARENTGAVHVPPLLGHGWKRERRTRTPSSRRGRVKALLKTRSFCKNSITCLRSCR